jgi:glycerophosphoryl diester phosphodiesterase
VQNRILIIAHRGVTYSGHPENSMPGFEDVLRENYDGVEMDVRLTKDKELVVFHDIRLERMTEDGRGMVRTKLLSELKKLRLRNSTASIPTLTEVLELFKPTDKLVNVEIKSEMPLRGKIEQRVIDVVHRIGVQSKIVLSSFNPLVIRKIQKIDPKMRTGFIYQKRLPKFNQKLAKGLIATSWHPNFRGVNALLLERAAESGCAVYPWTVNEESDLRRMMELEIDGVITDFPNRARWVFESGKKPF